MSVHQAYQLYSISAQTPAVWDKQIMLSHHPVFPTPGLNGDLLDSCLWTRDAKKVGMAHGNSSRDLEEPSQAFLSLDEITAI